MSRCCFTGQQFLHCNGLSLRLDFCLHDGGKEAPATGYNCQDLDICHIHAKGCCKGLANVGSQSCANVFRVKICERQVEFDFENLLSCLHDESRPGCRSLQQARVGRVGRVRGREQKPPADVRSLEALLQTIRGLHANRRGIRERAASPPHHHGETSDEDRNFQHLCRILAGACPHHVGLAIGSRWITGPETACNRAWTPH